MGFFDVTARDNLINFRNNTIEFFAIKKYYFFVHETCFFEED